ncbi:MAG: DUF5320 domain-containing protein [Chloroflexota bacterium]
MPRGDRTGPQGLGPMTGRSAGFCAGFGVPGYANPGVGRGGRGGGRGWRHQYYATGLPGWARAGYAAGPWAAPYAGPPAPEQEAGFLRNEAEQLRAALTNIEKRLADLETPPAPEGTGEGG